MYKMLKVSTSELQELWNISYREVTQLNDAPNDESHQLGRNSKLNVSAGGDAHAALS